MFRINRRKIVRAVRRIRILDVRAAGIARTVFAKIAFIGIAFGSVALGRLVLVRVAFIRSALISVVFSRVVIIRFACVSVAAACEIGGELRIPASKSAAWVTAAISAREPVAGRVRAIALSVRTAMSAISAVLVGGRTGILAGAGTTGEMLRIVLIALSGAGSIRTRSGRRRVPVNLFRLLPTMLRIDRVGRTAGSPVGLVSVLMLRA